jgi:hypothetical protein
MSELTIELDRLIQKAALDGALTEDAIAKFNKVLMENERMKAQGTIDAEKIGADAKEIKRLTTQRDNMQKQILLDAGRVADLEKREKDMTRNELLAEYSAIRVADHQEMFRIVFRNAVIKRDIVTPGSSTYDQYNNKTDNFPDKTPSEEEQT